MPHSSTDAMTNQDRKPSIYLAGPDVFRGDSVGRGRALKERCAARGVEGLYPLDGPETSDPSLIRDANLDMIRRADAVLADLSGFRGPHADDGTAFEVGFAFALGKPVFAYDRDVGEMRRRIDTVRTLEDGRRYDRHGMLIEDFGLTHNLMLACSVECVASSDEQALDYAAAFLLRPEGEAERREAILDGGFAD